MRGSGWLNLLITGSMLAGALLLAALVIAAVSRWRRRGERTLSPGDQLAHFRSLYERGAMSAEEFQRLRSTLSGQITGRADRAPAQAIQPEAQTQEPPPTAPAEEPPPDGIRPA
jgi:hypothetical protein